MFLIKYDPKNSGFLSWTQQRSQNYLGLKDEIKSEFAKCNGNIPFHANLKWNANAGIREDEGLNEIKRIRKDKRKLASSFRNTFQNEVKEDHLNQMTLFNMCRVEAKVWKKFLSKHLFFYIWVQCNSELDFQCLCEEKQFCFNKISTDSHLKLQKLSVLLAHSTLNVALLKGKKAAKKQSYLNEYVIIILLQDDSTVFPKPYPQFLLPIILSDLKLVL